MTPSQRRKKLNAFKKSKTKKGFSVGKLLIPFIAIVGFSVFMWATSRSFAKNQKITIVVNGPSQVYISTFDREGGRITNLTLPTNTQVNVSRELGTWRAESIWRLGEDEKLGGVLLAETIIKNLKIPVTAWADYPFYQISQGEIGAIFKSILPYKTSLGVGDRLRLALFSLTVSPAKRVNIDLAEAKVLRKTKLVGGEEGYVINENLPQSLYYIFSDPEINTASLRVEIQNYSASKRGAETLASVLEVMGGKAAAISKKESKDFFCEVNSRDKKIAGKVARIFGCKVYEKSEEGNFDLTIKVGEEFAKRF